MLTGRPGKSSWMKTSPNREPTKRGFQRSPGPSEHQRHLTSRFQLLPQLFQPQLPPQPALPFQPPFQPPFHPQPLSTLTFTNGALTQTSAFAVAAPDVVGPSPNRLPITPSASKTGASTLILVRISAPFSRRRNFRRVPPISVPLLYLHKSDESTNYK